MKRLFLILALALPIATLPGCKTEPTARVQQVTTLKVVGASAKASIDATAQLLKSGQVTVAQWQKVATFYDTRFQPAYSLAVSTVNSDLSSIASPDLLALAAQLAILVAEVYPQPTK